jgi:hypothetical protein
MQHDSLPVVTGFSARRALALRAALASLCSLSLMPVQAQTVIQNFDGFANTAALNANVSGATPNATITLSTSGGVGGSQALVFQGNDGANPYYTQFTFAMAPFSLVGLTDVTMQIQGIGNAGSRENFSVALISSGVSIASGLSINSQTISTTGFDTYTIAFSGLSDTIDSLRFTYGAIDYGTTHVTVDNVATVGVPEPGSLALSALGVVTFVLGRRRK